MGEAAITTLRSPTAEGETGMAIPLDDRPEAGVIEPAPQQAELIEPGMPSL